MLCFVFLIIGLLFYSISEKNSFAIEKYTVPYFHFTYLFLLCCGCLINGGGWKKILGGFDKWKWVVIFAKFWS